MPSTSAPLVTAAIVLAIVSWASPARSNTFDPPVVVPGCPGNYSISVGDVNGDGLKDVVAVSVDSLWVSTFLQRPEGGLGRGIRSQLREPCWEAALGDFDEDGKLDLAAPGIYSGWLFLYRGDGDSTFTYQRLYRPPPTFAPIAIAAGDVNGDGHLDLAILSWSTPGLIAILLGAGDGSFPTELDFETPSGSTDVALGDVNGDGKLDAIVPYEGYSAFTNDSVAVYLGKGDGTFTAGGTFQASLQPFHVAIGELNNDGNPDLAVVSLDGTVSVLLGIGDGTFAPPIHYAVGTRSRFVAIGDLDNDGWNDIVATAPEDATHGDSLAVLMNNRDGTFSGPVYQAAGVTAWGLALEDVTGDGKLDAVVASRRQDKVSFLRNCGACTPTAVELALLSAYADVEGVHFRWSVSEPLGSWATVERRTPTTEWSLQLPPTPVQSSIFAYDDATVSPGERYAYRLTVHAADRSVTTAEEWLSVPGLPAPRVAVVGRPVPNPMSSSVSIQIGLPDNDRAVLSIVDVRGRVVRRMPVGGRVGWAWVPWDGNDQSGRPVASGSYFLRLDRAGVTPRRLVVVR